MNFKVFSSLKFLQYCYTFPQQENHLDFLLKKKVLIIQKRKSCNDKKSLSNVSDNKKVFSRAKKKEEKK